MKEDDKIHRFVSNGEMNHSENKYGTNLRCKTQGRFDYWSNQPPKTLPGALTIFYTETCPTH